MLSKMGAPVLFFNASIPFAIPAGMHCLMRMKRMSNALEKAEKRAESLSSIEEDLDLGNGLTLESYWEEIAKVRDLQKRYNAGLSGVDQAYNELQAEEKILLEMTDHMLSAVKVKFGRDSYEYEMAGGVRHSERKRPRRKAKTNDNMPTAQA